METLTPATRLTTMEACGNAVHCQWTFHRGTTRHQWISSCSCEAMMSEEQSDESAQADE